jgi:ParB-like chromosome segregation protein Spo0J
LGGDQENELGSKSIQVRLDELRDSDIRVRLGPLRKGHIAVIRRLNGSWPPILVDRNDFSVIDGRYRVVAAQELGHSEIAAQLFDGPSDAAYLEALRRNTAKGLLLTLQERENAALFLLRSRAYWSDRKIAEVCGLSPSTVGRLRNDTGECPDVQFGQLDKREGRDDRHRPIDMARARDRIRDALRENPGASLRTIARQVDCSPETVRSVRGRLQGAGESRSAGIRADLPPVGIARAESEPDLAMISMDDGVAFVTWFAQSDVNEELCRKYLTKVPLSRVYQIADEARRRADMWNAFARDLETRTNVRPDRS